MAATAALSEQEILAEARRLFEMKYYSRAEEFLANECVDEAQRRRLWVFAHPIDHLVRQDFNITLGWLREIYEACPGDPDPIWQFVYEAVREKLDREGS